MISYDALPTLLRTALMLGLFLTCAAAFMFYPRPFAEGHLFFLH